MAESNIADEVWKVIPDHPNYEASDCGRIRRATPGRGTRAGRVPKLKFDRVGYAYFTPSAGGVAGRHLRVHIAVAAAFHGPRPPGMSIDHVNGVRTDNRPSNLQYVTHAANMKRAGDLGLLPRGERHCSARLTEAIVLTIRERHASSETQASIARFYGVHIVTVNDVILGKTWKHC